MTTRRIMRGHAGSQTFDPSFLQEVFGDDRLWVVMARVDLHEGEATHFLLDVDELGNRVLYVDVVTTPGDIELRCTIPCAPIARIPAIGEKVYVCIPDGRLDSVPAIIAVVGNLQAQAGLTEERWVLQLDGTQKLLVHRGDASAAQQLPTMADFNALREHVDHQFDAAHGHIHVTPSGPTTTIASASGPYTTGPTHPAPTPDGTQTLEVE